MAKKVTLLDTIAEIISNDDDAHHFRDSALEGICYVAAWLRERSFWQAADVLINEVKGDHPRNLSEENLDG